MLRSALRIRRPCLAVVLLGFLAAPAAARTCFLNITPTNFGTYVPGSPAPSDANGRVRVSCFGRATGGQANSYALKMDGGWSGNPANRAMQHNNQPLYYNIFKDAARTDIWGDGTNGTTPITRAFGNGNVYRRNHRTYGRAFGSQNPSPGLYQDILTVTIEF